MNGSIYVQWYYLAFLAPAGAAALLLLLSGLRLGGHRGHHHGSGGVRHTGPPGAGHRSAASAAKHGSAGSRRNATRSDGTMVHGAAEFLLAMAGFNRVPPLMMFQMFFLCGGLAGFWSNRLLLGAVPEPSFLQWLPSLAIAVVVGMGGARLGAELIARVMPQDATSVVQRDGLIGLIGKVVYSIGETSGRVHVYDDFGTLHDENCRIAPGHAPIDKGGFARIVDRDASGQFLVEESSEPPIRLR